MSQKYNYIKIDFKRGVTPIFSRNNETKANIMFTGTKTTRKDIWFTNILISSLSFV